MSDKEHVQTAIQTADRILAQAANGFKADIRDITLKCPDDLAVVSLQISATGAERRLRLSDRSIRSIEVVSLSKFSTVPNAVLRLESGWQVEFPTDEESWGVRIEFELLDRTLLRRLVFRDHDREGKPTGDDDVYWMSAQLRNIQALSTSYGRVNLRDVDFLVNVAVHNDIKAKVPRAFVRQMELSVLLVREKDRNKKLKLMWEQMRLQRVGPHEGKNEDTLSEIQDLFVPTHFARFVQVTNQFKFSDVRRGTDASERSIFPTFPKAMTVISQTDLSVNQPAASGEVVYRKTDFQGELSKFFPKLAGTMK